MTKGLRTHIILTALLCHIAEAEYMICSMTGFGRGRNTVNGRTITVEIRSVNHRYLELSTRLPKEFYPLDQKIRRVVQERIS